MLIAIGERATSRDYEDLPDGALDQLIERELIFRHTPTFHRQKIVFKLIFSGSKTGEASSEILLGFRVSLLELFAA
jgi:hypothetical protein